MGTRYAMEWPEVGLAFTGYVHEVMNFRYNWHEADYELNILLHGSAEYCRGDQLYHLKADDVLLIDPGVGHASLALEQDTIALVLHFPAATFRPFLSAKEIFSFADCVSGEATRQDHACRSIRFYAAQLLLAAEEGGPFASLTARGALEMLLSTLCTRCGPRRVPCLSGDDTMHRETILRITRYLNENYPSKITLEDLARFTQYNRTYISTLFKNTLGMNFYEYLLRVRFQHAAFELASTDKTLTQVAIDNGFPDLKSFNARFLSTFGRTPAEYRSQVVPARTAEAVAKLTYHPLSSPLVAERLRAYACLPEPQGDGV